jgi:RimJ/RimL family protein N-acetyltransferase
LIGRSSYLNPRPEHDGLEIGWTWLRRPAWRTGANLEAKLLLLEHAFGALGCMRVEFKTDARNERSREALAALPATFEGVFRKHMLAPGVGVRDSAYFSILDEEWPAVRSNLERRLAEAPAQQPQALGSRDA